MQLRTRHPQAGLAQGIPLRGLVHWLAVLPFLLLSLILPGTMPMRDAQGALTVVLCAGAGLIEMGVAADGSLFPIQKPPHGDAHACDWAPHGGPALGITAFKAQPLPGAARPLWLALALAVPPRRAELRMAVARGPPVLI